MRPITLDIISSKHPLFDRLSKLGLPGNKTEQYRHFAIKPILAKEYNLASVNEQKPKPGLKLIINNGAIQEYPAGVKISFIKDYKLNSNHFDVLYYLSHAACSEVICIEIADDIHFDIEHHFTLSNTFLPYRLCVKTANNSKVEIFESFFTDGTQDSLLLYGIDALIARDSTMSWIRNENCSDAQSVVIGTHYYDVAKQGALELKTFDFGSGVALHLYEVDLDEHSWIDAVHLLLALKHARRGNVLFINHNKPYAKSVQDVRTILKDSANGIFDGKIRVGHDAKYSDAKQNSQAILLGEKATMHAKPQLEIYTDELEASHGSTIGQLDENALFYLRSRGISLQEAQKIIVLAFANNFIETIGNKEDASKIYANFEASYYS